MEDIKQRIRRMLDECGAEYTWLEHEHVTSMDECRPIGQRLGAPHCKNLLLSNRQRTKNYLLLTDDTAFRTAAFARALGVSRVSFVPGEDMPKLLGVQPGAASALALINDVQGSIRLVVDAKVAAWSRVCVHPGDSTASLVMDTQALLELCRTRLNHPYDIIRMQDE